MTLVTWNDLTYSQVAKNTNSLVKLQLVLNGTIFFSYNYLRSQNKASDSILVFTHKAAAKQSVDKPKGTF